MKLVFHSNLSKNLSLILNDADDYNVIIQVGENQNTKEFHAHSVILRARSPYFKNALSANRAAKKNNMIMFNKPIVTPIVFEMILKYIYTGEIDFAKQSGENILGLLIAVDELLLEKLFDHIQDYLIEKHNSWIELANIIANWIDNKDAKFTRTISDPLYKFKLIYRGSRDGINNKSFRGKCNGRVASLVLIEEKKSNMIFGGYSSIGFSSLGDQYLSENNARHYYSSDNFIFSFENSEDVQNMKIGRVINSNKAILEMGDSVGFNFGWGSFCMDKKVFYINKRNYYESISNEEHITGTIKEVEAFVVTNN
ncbi:BTB/POZ protein [Rhizophagus irregularis DAOM 181602=DAOM 197198]|uniref:Uncharacterized protein n=2 Tax=Rhizophagus irregularis TaxID=588596 RepID=U9SUD7_RHIID|nr:BTB/POZ protein [Rhizophagus irregularis DAOM 181602=DAOM 197198]